MAFLETPRLDPLITHGARSEVEFSRTKTYAFGGRLKQNFNWAKARHTLTLSYRPRPLEHYDELRDFFYNIMGGAYEGFRAKDWSNYLLTQDNSSLTLVTGSTFQINRLHTAGAVTYLHPIKKPVDGIVIKRNRSSAITTAGATVDNETGIATISGHLDGDTYTAEGEFDLPVTFESDRWVTSLQGTSDNLWLSPEPIKLEEITRSLA
jgi:uncharacterized protein (TIGR02217 family)